jgi:hypothetical protein
MFFSNQSFVDGKNSSSSTASIRDKGCVTFLTNLIYNYHSANFMDAL